MTGKEQTNSLKLRFRRTAAVQTAVWLSIISSTDVPVEYWPQNELFTMSKTCNKHKKKKMFLSVLWIYIGNNLVWDFSAIEILF